MKTKQMRKELCRIFGYDTWKGPQGLQQYLEEATDAFPVTVDWRCMAVGRRKDGEHCAFGERIGRVPGVDKCFASEHFTYIRFDGDPTIYRYENPLDMQHQINFFDNTGMFDDMEEGETFVLEPPSTARSHVYARNRREAIKGGTWTVKPRGPNLNRRVGPIHHFRPY